MGMARKVEIDPKARELALHMASVRDLRQLTNGVLAVRMGLSESSVKKLFTGEVHANFLKLAKLAQVMGVTPNELLNFSEPEQTDRIKGAFEAIFAAMGFREQTIQQLTAAVLKSLSSPILPGQSAHQSVHSRIALEVERAVQSKPQQ